MKRPKKKPEEFKGYYYDHQRQKFRVQFSVGGKQYRLGLYDTPEIAHRMYLIEREKKIKELELQAIEFNKLVERRAKIIKAGGDVHDPEWMAKIIAEEESSDSPF